MKRTILAAAAAAAVLAATAPAATAAPYIRETTVTIPGAPAPGPAFTQQLKILKVGPENAGKVLVLIAGRGEAAGGFRDVAKDLVARTPGLQVWAVDRREQNLADLAAFRAGPDVAAQYYLSGAYRHQDAKTAPYAANWGLDLELRDVRQAVLAARDHGRRQVILGGHSLGATAVLDYAAWDFDGAPGYRDLSGLVLLDGGVRTALSGAGIDFSITEQGARDWQAQIDAGAVFDNATSLYNNFGDGAENAAIDYQLAATYAASAPHAPSPIQDRLPAAVRPDRQLTNAGLLGWLVDEHAALPGYAVTSGHLNAAGDWVDDGKTPLSRVAREMSGTSPAAWEWYSPNRLALDYFGTATFADDAVARQLGLRLKHVAEINVPMYVFQSSLTNGTVGDAAAAVAKDTKIPRVSINTDNSMTHLDILFAAPEQNSFVRTAVPFLKSLR